jgi:threonine aldolase
MVNLYSDTQTRPTPAMRRAMAEAEVGDEQGFRDPTVNALCTRVAELLGFEAAVFLPSGTMCNEIAFRLHIRPGGDEAILHRTAHPIHAEAGGPAAFAGAMLRPLDSADGTFTGDDVRAALRPASRYEPRSRLVSLEQTANLAGGRVWPLERIRDVVAVAQEAGLRLHMDGARLMNAVVAAGVPAAEFTRGFDTAWLDFTKGLGAPLGAVLCGSAEFIGAAWRWKQRLGGSMRQAGICAAACLHALDHHVDRLAEDHANAKALARGLSQIPGVVVEEPDTNLVFFDVRGAGTTVEALQERLLMQGGAVSGLGGRVRACTHLDVTAPMIEEAIGLIREAVAA